MKPYTDEEYQFLLDAYTGLGGFKDGRYLIKHPRETDEKFLARKKLAYYPNFTRKVLNAYISHLFKEPVNRDIADNIELENFWNKANLKGEYIDKAMKRYSALANVVGTLFLIVDRKPIPALTRAEDLANTPYLVPKLPTEVVDYSVDQSGQLEWIVFVEIVTSKTFQEETKPIYQFRYFDKESWKVLKGEDIFVAKTIESGIHALGKVPVVPLHSIEPQIETEIFGSSFIFEIAKTNHRLYNALSELDEILRNQTFSILTLPISNPADKDQYENMTLSTENALLYDPSHGGEPKFIAPPTNPTEAYEKRIAELINYIYKLASLEFTGGVQKSGVAMAFDFQETNSALASFAQNIEEAEYQIIDLVGRWFDKDLSDAVVEYKKDFSVVDLQQELKNAIDVLALDISKKFNIELKKKLAYDFVGDRLEEEQLQEIYEEIENSEDFMAENRMRNEGLI